MGDEDVYVHVHELEKWESISNKAEEEKMITHLWARAPAHTLHHSPDTCCKRRIEDRPQAARNVACGGDREYRQS